MRRKVRILGLAAIVAALIVPFGFALSNESAGHGDVAVAHAATPFPDVVATSTHPVAAGTVIVLPNIPEGAKLLAIGTILFGVAAAMRRTS
jgi:hypothetical protein